LVHVGSFGAVGRVDGCIAASDSSSCEYLSL
jgi:hypothetical protein